MKKKIFKVVSLTVFVLIAGFTVYASHKSEMTLSDVALANVEALANNESGTDCQWKRVQNSNGIPYDACLADGNGNPCVCGSVDYH